MSGCEHELTRARVAALTQLWRDTAELIQMQSPGNPASAALIQCAAELDCAVNMDDEALRLVMPEVLWP